MSQKYFVLMNETLRALVNTSKTLIVPNRQIRILTRSMHIIQAFCKGRALGSVECGDYTDKDFKIAVFGALQFMKTHAGKKSRDFENFVEWLQQNSHGEFEIKVEANRIGSI